MFKTDEETLDWLRTLEDHIIVDTFDRIETLAADSEALDIYARVWIQLAMEHGRIDTVCTILDKYDVPADNMTLGERISYFKLFIKQR